MKVVSIDMDTSALEHGKGRKGGNSLPIHTVYTSASRDTSYRTKSIIIATGASPRWLGADNEEV